MLYINKNAAEQKPDKLWLVSRGNNLSFAQQWQRCYALLDWCEKNSIMPGEFILVAVSDDLEQASLLTGLISIGRTPVILDPEATTSEARSILDNLVYSAVLAESIVYNKWRLEEYNKPYLPVVITRNQGSLFGRLLVKKQASNSVTTWPAIIKDFPYSPIAEQESKGLAYLIFTSGTTSKPKGVEISHKALASQLQTLHEHFSLDETCRLLNVLPMHHVDGFVQGPLSAWVAGATLYRPAMFSAASVQTVMDSIYSERITHMIAVPTMLALILRLGVEFSENFKSSDFRYIISCAGHLESSLWQSFEELYGVQIANLYGLTETVTSALISGPDIISRRVGTLGLAINCEIQIMLENGLQAKPEEIGELLISSEQLMNGYHGDSVASDAVLKNGWLHTGDLVKRLSSGHIELVGRLKNLIISGGRNISPEEVTACINLHPNVIESVVLGLADQDWGEIVTALIVLDGSVNEADMVLWCRERLSEYKIPRRILPVGELKKGPSGKVQIEVARQQLIEMLSIKTHVVKNTEDTEAVVLSEAASCFRLPINQLSLNSGPENTLGWNSLEHMELVLALEARFEIKFTAREIMQIDCLKKAVELCVSKTHK